MRLVIYSAILLKNPHYWSQSKAFLQHNIEIEKVKSFFLTNMENTILKEDDCPKIAANLANSLEKIDDLMMKDIYRQTVSPCKGERRLTVKFEVGKPSRGCDRPKASFKLNFDKNNQLIDYQHTQFGICFGPYINVLPQ